MTQTITLRDGRTLAYAEYGQPGGVPIIYCHGIPSSRVEADLNIDPDIITSVNARVIVPDRPGVGRSDYQNGRRIQDWPLDVGELATRLGLERFVVLGISGGAPYALACGAQLGQVAAVGIVGGVAPLEAPGISAAFSTPLRMVFRLSRVAPPILRALFRLNLRAIRSGGPKAGERMIAMAPEPDRVVLRNRPHLAATFMACFEEACRNGTRGPVTDTGLVAHPWGLDLATLQVPVFVWHGVHDRNVPVECGKYFARTIGRCQATFYADDGHLSVLVNHATDIWSTLVASFHRPGA